MKKHNFKIIFFGVICKGSSKLIYLQAKKFIFILRSYTKKSFFLSPWEMLKQKYRLITFCSTICTFSFMFFNYYQFCSKKNNQYVKRIKLYLHSLMKRSNNDGILLTNKHKENMFKPRGNIRMKEYLFLPAIILYPCTLGIAYITPTY